MPRITCPHTTWTQLTATAGPAQLTVQLETVAPVWVVFAASAPADVVRVPADAANYVQLGEAFPALATAALSGTSLRAWGRPVRDEAATVAATEVL